MSEYQEPASETGIRVLLVGRSEALDRLGRILSPDVDVRSVTTPSEADEPVRQADCLISDESHVSALRDRTDLPILSLVTDSVDEMTAGATDVIQSDVARELATARVRNVVNASKTRASERGGVLLDSSEAVVAVTTPEGRIDRVGGAVDRALGYTPETLRDEPLDSIVPEGYRRTVSDHRRSVAESSLDATESFSARVRRRSGGTEHVQITVRNRLADPALNGLVWTVVPVTEPEQVDVPDATIEQFDDPVVTLDEERTVTAANDAATRRFGPRGDAPIGFEFWELVPGETLDTWYEGVSEVAARGSTGSFVVDGPTGDDIDVVTVYPDEKRVTLIAQRREGTLVDRYRFDLERTAALLDVVPGPAFLVHDGAVSTANRATIDYASVDSVVGRPLATVVGDRTAATIQERASASIRRVDPIEWHPTVGGEERTVALTVDTVHDRIAVAGRDVTDHRRVRDAAIALNQATDDPRFAETIQSTRRRTLTALVTALDVSVGIWYRRTDDRLSPVTSVGTPDGSVPTVAIDPGTIPSLAEDPADFGPVGRIPISSDTVIENAIALALSTDEVVVVGSSPTSLSSSGTESGPGRRGRDIDAATVPRDADGRWSGEPAPGPDSRLAVLTPILRTFVRIERTLVSCRADTRELQAALRSEERRRGRIASVFDRYDELVDVALTAPTRKRLEQRICGTVEALDEVATVAVLSGTEPVTVRARSGSIPQSIATVVDQRDDTGDSPEGTERVRGPLVDVVGHVLDSGEQVVERVDPHPGDRAEPDDETGTEGAVIVTPLDGRTLQEGVLLVYVDAVNDRDLYERLGQHVATVTALGIDAIESIRALHASESIELELTMDVSRTDALAMLASTLDTRVDLDAVVPAGNGLTCYVTVQEDVDVDPSGLVEAIGPIDRIERLQETDRGTRLELLVDEHPYVEAVASHGGVVTSVEVRDGDATVGVDLPSDRDVRALVETVRSTIPTTALATRRPASRADEPDPSVSSVLDSLTDRQRQILRTAHAAGYFEWPRERTGEEIADRLDISQPTFTRHFRAAERRIFDLLFESDGS
ncbi:bacterio-opsin activator domain-containing protein [Halovivax cerinus]|uniref:Bacterio-opsin activator domain-containing protein n=1 Tax=Halovivax cerinus TaxID=1487865 RepID=A0ABD5NN32_9EURY|nr:bacterio-opsin activator domain-containing protein [Halovivax cerinus]